MDLHSIVRNHTRLIDDAIKGFENQISSLSKDKDGSEEIAKNARLEVEKERATMEERRKTLSLLNAKVIELEKQIKELHERLKERKVDLNLALQNEEITRDRITDRRKRERESIEKITKLNEKIIDCENETTRQQKRLTQAKLTAFSVYLDSIWKQLCDYLITSDVKSSKIEALKLLEIARHEDPKVGNFWEQREAWNQIIASPVPPEIIEKAKIEKSQIEAILDKEFPGALEALEMKSTENDIILEFFYSSPIEMSLPCIYLPIPIDICNNINLGLSGEFETLAIQIIWAISSSVKHSKEAATFKDDREYCIFNTGMDVVELEQQEYIRIKMPNNGSAAVILSQLPADIEEAMRCEDPNE